MASKKIHLDKYYSPQELADYCTQKAIDVIGIENITELVESSAGNGVFLNSFEKLLPNVPYKAYDIEPEDDRIIKQDYLELDMEYKKGRVIIGNPPFGDRSILVKQFYNKSLNIGDYIAFILPITQLNNSQSLYKFELIYSEDLNVISYSDRDVHCCFNVYKRDKSGLLLDKMDYSLKDIDIIEYKRGKEIYFQNYDYSICTWGNGSCGKIPSFKGQFAQEHYIIVNNLELKDKIINVCKSTDWKNEVAPKNTSSKKIQTWRIYKYLKEKIPELE